MQKSEHSSRAAKLSDAPAIGSLVELAYGHYVERIGFSPRPMEDDYVLL